MGGTLLQFVTAIFMARTLGVDEYGTYVYAFTWATVLALFISMGTDQVNIREIPRLIQEEKRRELAGILIATLFVVLAVSGVVFVLLTILEKTELIRFSPSATLITVVAITIATISILAGLNQAFQKILFSQFLGRLLMPSLYLALLGLWAYHNTLTAKEALVIYGISGVFILTALSSNVLKDILTKIQGLKKPDVDLISLVKSSVPLAFVSFTYLINSSVDIIIIGLYLEESDVAIYRAANRGAAFIGLILVVVNQVFMPMLSQSLAQKNHSEAQRLISLVSAILLGLGITAGVVMFFGSLLFLSLFGPEFSEGDIALKFLMIGSLADVFSGTVGAILILNNREGAIFKINLFGILLNVALNLLLIADYGINGAAIATAIALCLTRLLMIVYVIRKTDFDPLFFIALLRKFNQVGSS